MKAHGLERVEGLHIKHLTDEIGKRAFLSICKMIADGIPVAGHVGSDEWSSSSIGRSLTDDEARSAASIALWIEGAAKDLVCRLLSDSRDETILVVRGWIKKDAELSKYTKFKNTDGRKQGAKTNKKKAVDAKDYYRPIITALINANSHLSRSEIAGRIIKDEHKIVRRKTWLRTFAEVVRSELTKPR